MPEATATDRPAGPAPPAAGHRAFGLLWLGQLVSLVGSGLTRFALGIWVYERTGSVTQFALISIFLSLPGLLVAPFAGALVDRWDRRLVLFLSDVGSGAGTLAIAALMWTGSLEIWHVYLVVGLGSVFEAFQTPAYVAATTLLVPKKHFGRVGGMIQLAHAAAGVVALPIAGVLYVTIGLAGVVLVDFATFLFAALTLAFFRIPRPPASADGRAARGALWREAVFGWRFIRARPGLFGLLLYFAQMNLALGVAFVLVIPLVSSFADAATLGVVLGIQSAGHLVGSVVMTATGGPRRRIHGVLASGFAASLFLALVGLRPEVPLVAAALFGLMVCFPVINGSSQAIWQAKVPPDVQGRVFAVRRMIAQFTAPLAYLLAGPLADRVFEPMMTAGGALAPIFGPLVGTGPGRGIALIYVLVALPTAVFTVWGYLRPRIRNLEDELPDAVD